MAVMPMFPLGTVLLPGGVLPLHVFEPRYRQLVVDCLADDTGDPEFGVTLIERGWEVGGGDQRADVGVVAWLPDDPYPLADVDDWPDVDPDAPDLRTRVTELTERMGSVLAVAVALGDVRAEDVDLSGV